MKLDSGTVNIK